MVTLTRNGVSDYRLMTCFLFQIRSLTLFRPLPRYLPQRPTTHRLLSNPRQLYSMSSITTNRTPLPTVPETDPSRCVLDSYRIAIAKIVGEALGLSVEQVYPGVQYGKKGIDFTVALPRFRLPGSVGDLGKKVIEKVCVCMCWCCFAM